MSGEHRAHAPGRLQTPIRFPVESEAGHRLDLEVISASIGEDGRGHTDQRIEVRVTGTHFAEIASRALFHFDAELRPPAVPIDYDRPATLELRLDASMAAADATDAEQLARSLVSAVPTVAAARCWYLTRVRQDAGPHPIDVETMWAFVTPSNAPGIDLGAQIDGAMEFVRRYPPPGLTGEIAESALTAAVAGVPDDPVDLLDAVGSMLERWGADSGLGAHLRPRSGDATPSGDPQTLVAAANRLLAAWGFYVAALPDDPAVVFGVIAGDETFECLVEVAPEGSLVAYALAPEPLPSNAMAAALEWTCRVNAGLAVGNFDYDSESGQVVFRSGIDLAGTPLSGELLQALVSNVIETMEHFLPALRALAGGASAGDAFAARS